jgi:hypothetical protein
MTAEPTSAAQVVADYQPPAITDLGTLAEMTLGGGGTAADGFSGAAGSSGSL